MRFSPEKSGCVVKGMMVEPARFRGRAIDPTNRPLVALSGRGLFRDDFFYRLCSDVIQVPPSGQRLQEAPGELRQLLEHALTRIIGEPAAELVAQVEATLWRTLGERFPWLWNVRELEQAVRHILLAGQYTGSTPPKGPDLREHFIAGIEAAPWRPTPCWRATVLCFTENPATTRLARLTHLDRRTVKKYYSTSGQAICLIPKAWASRRRVEVADKLMKLLRRVTP